MEYYETPVKRPRTRQSSTADHLRLDHNHELCIDENTAIHIREILSRLQQVVSTKQRVHVLHQLLRVLGYQHATRLFTCHAAILSKFVQGNCIHSLCLQLGYALHRRSLAGEDPEVGSTTNPHKNPYNEVHLICIALDSFYRQCPELVTENFIQRSGSEVLRLTRQTLLQQQTEASNTTIALPIVSIWHSFSACHQGTMLLFQQADTLGLLNSILSRESTRFLHNTDGAMETILECLGLLKNLSYYAEDHRNILVNQSNLLSTLTSLTDVPSDKARERLSAVIRNLSLSVDVRTVLIQSSDVLACLLRLSQHARMHHAGKPTLRNVLIAIANLAIDTSSCHVLLFFGDGIWIRQLQHCMLKSEDAVARKRAIKGLRLLAKDPSSTMVLLQTNNRLEILLQACLYDPNEGVRHEAIEAFCQCATWVRSSMGQHAYVLNALTQLLTATITNRGVVTRALHEQATHPANRRSMAQHKHLLQALVALIGTDDAPLHAKDSACSVLATLSADEPLAIGLPVVLDALVKTLLPQSTTIGNTSSNNVERMVTTRIRHSSVQTILHLAQQPRNLPDMARHTALLQSLLRFAAAATTPEDLKKDTKAVILRLAEEL